ncbi:DUF3231 family protein [Paenibacillus cremeus]|uniref:DUF3231 family protein n=1 Tax=Paenibacillus cremeus TaxID=2163881 RepID=A0A559KH73_9BACL|nr:DUF3231 family protein [Paenibacillus cremeus]TVY11428.1 DUF3231 family protein [Paenibacillus cremeus]
MDHNPKLTSSELGVLWNAYMQNTAVLCFVKHFDKNNEDQSIDALIKTALNNIQFAVEGSKQIFEIEKSPVPFGFNESDVNLEVSRLYSDLFALRYIKYISAVGIAAAAVSLELSARTDVRTYFTKIIESLSSQYNSASDLLLQKGVFIRSPIIPVPEKVEYIQEESFLSGVFGRHRPITAVELSHVSKNLETNSIGRTFILGFSQIAQSIEVKEYFTRGKEIAEKHEDIFREILLKDDLPLPSVWDSTISHTTTPIFSDKLMMFHVATLNATSVSSYGGAIAGSLRKDLGVQYMKLLTEVIEYADDGVKIMIKNQWLEQPPQAPDRVALRRNMTI